MLRYSLFIFLCFVACDSHHNRTNNCSYGGVDYIFTAHYQNCLAVIGQYQLGNDKITTGNFLKALTCLNAITGIKDNVYRGDSMGYMSESDYYKDLDAWSHWYSENSGSFSFDDGFKKFEDYRKAEEEEVTWPPMLVEMMIKN